MAEHSFTRGVCTIAVDRASAAPGWSIGNQPSAILPACRNATSARAPVQTGIGPLDREWRDPGAGDVLVIAGNRDAALGPQSAQQRNLLGESRAAIREVLPEPLVLDLVPTKPHPEAESALREQVDLGRVLGDQHGLALTGGSPPR